MADARISRNARNACLDALEAVRVKANVRLPTPGDPVTVNRAFRFGIDRAYNENVLRGI